MGNDASVVKLSISGKLNINIQNNLNNLDSTFDGYLSTLHSKFLNKKFYIFDEKNMSKGRSKFGLLDLKNFTGYIKSKDGDEFHLKEGALHRENDKPSVRLFRKGNIIFEAWYFYGELKKKNKYFDRYKTIPFGCGYLNRKKYFKKIANTSYV